MTAFNRSNDFQNGDAPVEAARKNPIHVIWHRRWWVILTMILFAGAGVAYLMQARELFRSQAQLYVYQRSPMMLTSDPMGGLTMGSNNYLFTQAALIQSRAILNSVAERPDIVNLPTFQGPEASDVISYLRMNVIAGVGRRDELIGVSVTSPYAEDSAKLANAIVQAYIEYQSASGKQTAGSLVGMLTTQRDTYERELAAKRKELLDFQLKHSYLNLGSEQSNPIYTRLATLSSALTQAQLDTLNAQSAIDATKAMMDDPTKIAMLLSSREFKSDTAELRRELRTMKTTFSAMDSVYGGASPSLKGMNERLTQLTAELETESQKTVEAYLVSLEQRLKTSEVEKRQIQDFLNEQLKQVMDLNSKSAEFIALKSEFEQLFKAADLLNQRIKDLDLSGQTSGMNVRVVEDAKPNRAPVYPQKATILFQFLACGLAVGVALAFLRDLMDQRLRSAEEIKQVVQLPVLGVIPHIQNAKTLAERGQALHKDPMSDVAEAYRTVRTAVYFGSNGGVVKTLLVTSPAPGDGKSTLCSNLAIAMAQAGNKVLLLDCDFRKPTQHKIFELDKPAGLSNVLAGEKDLHEAIQTTDVQGLSLLPCGPIPANPSEILNSQTFADLLEELKEEYDMVLLDSPPVLPVTDSRILAASADATVLALRAEKSTRRNATFSRDTLRAVGANLVGVVVNDVPRKKGLYGYYYAYGETYQYGYGASKNRAPQGGMKPAAQVPAESR